MTKGRAMRDRDGAKNGTTDGATDGATAALARAPGAGRASAVSAAAAEPCAGDAAAAVAAMTLTVGPVPFLWPRAEWRAFYEELATIPSISRVVLGEMVCSKRLALYGDEIARATELLRGAGKAVALTSLGLVTLSRERRLTAALMGMGLEVEVNDLTALAHLPEGAAFSVGPLVNCYNEGTLGWLAGQGARRFCLPPELPPGAVAALAGVAGDLPVEIWAWGRLPLAIAGRCYHARMHGRSKDKCRFLCGEDRDGRAVNTLDGQAFLAVNGVQTLSARCANAAHQLPALAGAGVRALRLSPQSRGFAAVCTGFADLLAGRTDAGRFSADRLAEAPGGAYCDGYLWGGPGAAWSGGRSGREPGRLRRPAPGHAAAVAGTSGAGGDGPGSRGGVS